MAGTDIKEGAVTEPQYAVDLNGQFSFKVDSKGRMALPAKFRKVLPETLVVARELKDDCVYVFVKSDFDLWVDKLFQGRFGGYQESNHQHVELRRKLKGRAFEVEVDASGRIMIPQDVRRAVGIDKDVIILGNTGRFEVWDAKRFERVDSEVDLGLLYS